MDIKLNKVVVPLKMISAMFVLLEYFAKGKFEAQSQTWKRGFILLFSTRIGLSAKLALCKEIDLSFSNSWHIS